MKKIFALVLALLMVGSVLAACGDSAPQGGEVTPLPEKETTAPTEQETTPAETEPEETEPEETEPVAEAGDKEVSLGAMQGGVYTNTYVGFTCTLDENWEFATAEQLQDLPGAVSDLFTDSSLSDQLGTQIFDMQAENTTDLVSMNVVYQKLDMATRLLYATMSEEAIIYAVLAQQNTMIETYAQAGIVATKLEKVTVTFCGETRTAILMTATLSDVPYFTLQLFDNHLGEYAVTTTFASFVENNTESLLAMCSPA